MNQKPDNPDLDKTFVEGPNEQMHELKAGAKININSENVTAAYTKTQISTSNDLAAEEKDQPLGSGKIVSMLGTGGMAKVYKIWNEKLEVFRAVKILLPTQQADLMNRFETEAKITAKLHHPNIVEIYNVGEWKKLPYLEMELIDGFSLEAIINKTGKLPESVSCSIAIFITRALSYAHVQKFLLYGKNYTGIIHRDLKPANIMIDKNGTVKLMDFGIARPTETSFHTVEGSIVGTLQYLAPEQIDGEGIDHGADIYALGAILYEMLTGTKTFPQKTITNLMKKKATNEYRRFEDFEFRVNSNLSKVAQKCLSVSKENRYESAKDLLTALESALKSLTNDSPEDVIKTYLDNPDSLKTKSKINFLRFVKPKIVIPIAATATLAGLVYVFIKTGPKSSEKSEIKKPDTTQQIPTVSKGVTANKIDAPFDDAGLRPLAPTQKEPEKVAPSSPPVEKQKSAKQKPRARPRPTRKPKKLSALEELKKNYGSDDFVTVGKSALQKGNAKDAILALENASSNSDEKILLLLDAYIREGRNKDALYIVNSQTINDGQFNFLAGKTYYGLNNNAQALKHFENALIKPSKIRSRGAIRNDALYYSALVRSRLYNINPSQDNRGQAMNAWSVVKRMYDKNRSHSRYKKATKELHDL